MGLGLAVISAIIIFMLLVCAGILLFHRDAAPLKLSSVISPFGTEKQTFGSKFQAATASLGTAVGQLEGVVPKSQAEISVVQQRLIRAGMRRETAVNKFYGAKVVTIGLFVLIALVSGVVKQNPLLGLIAAVGLGYLAPDFWLGRKIKER